MSDNNFHQVTNNQLNQFNQLNQLNHPLSPKLPLLPGNAFNDLRRSYKKSHYFNRYSSGSMGKNHN